MLLLCTLTSLSPVYGQESYRALEKKGEAFYNAGRHKEAYDTFKAMELLNPGFLNLKEKIGVSLYHINRIAEAKIYLSFVADNDKHVSPDVYLYLAMAHHADNEFRQAVYFYKIFLKNVALDHPLRARIKDDIKRCAYGLRNPSPQTDVIVENLGYKVNSEGDEFAPILSPNYSTKLYFSSAREGTLGGRRNTEGIVDEVSGEFCADMFYSSVINGEWTATTPLSYLLNSPKNDAILDFSKDGTTMYFFKGYTLYSGDIMVDTFKRLEERTLYAPPFESPMRPEQGDVSMQLFNDSILLFSSRRDGGFGGLDLYITTHSNGQWSEPENLGPKINTPYDETSPFLAKNGRVLYYSSNRSDRSYGGLDIFRAEFSDRSESWSEPENMGLPVNSSHDDMHFRLIADGLKAYYSSSRKSGLGKRDIYAVYFKNFQSEMANEALPVAFHLVDDLKEKLETGGGFSEANAEHPFPSEPVKEFTFSPIHFNNDADLLRAENLAVLGNVIRFLNEYPQAKVRFTSHSDNSEPKKFDLFFSIRRAETLSKYLTDQGVSPSRIFLTGCGSQFPLALNEIRGSSNPVGQKLNRRIDIGFLLPDNPPVKIKYLKDQVSLPMKADGGEYFERSIKGLYYKVEIASIGQMYNGNLIVQYPHATVETSAIDPRYYYTVGLYQTFSSADQLKKELQNSGVPGATVIPYVNGFRITGTEEMNKFAQSYPDLRHFLVAKEAGN